MRLTTVDARRSTVYFFLTLIAISFIFLRNLGTSRLETALTPLPQLDDRAPGAPPLAGHVVVFTGKLFTLTRKQAQALVHELGGVSTEEVTSRTTLLVIGAEGFPSAGPKPLGEITENGAGQSAKLRKAEAVNAKSGGQIRVVTEADFCALAGLPSPDQFSQRFFGLRDIRGMYPRVREDYLRYLEKWGLIQSVVRTNAGSYYSFSDLLIIKAANAELERDVPFRVVLRSLIAEREGQLAFDFRPLKKSDTATARVVTLDPAAARPTTAPRQKVGIEPGPDFRMAAQYFLEGSSLDDGHAETQDQAAAAYRKALAIDPTLAPALVNLANIHYARDQAIEAQALYERAISVDPECFEAHFNLGNVYHDLGRYDEAAACYRDALVLDPSYAEAHFYLAVTLEKMGQSADAKPHWRAYQQLAPTGEWVDLAREFSEGD